MTGSVCEVICNLINAHNMGTGVGTGAGTETVTGAEAGTGTGMKEGRGESEHGNPSYHDTSRKEDAREGAVPTGNQKHQLRGLMPKRVCRIIRGLRSQGQEGRNQKSESGVGGMRHENPTGCRRDTKKREGVGRQTQKLSKKNIDTADTDPGQQDSNHEAESRAHQTEGLQRGSRERESASPLSRLVTNFVATNIDHPQWGANTNSVK